MAHTSKSKTLLAIAAVATLSALPIAPVSAQGAETFSAYNEASTTTVDTQPYQEIMAALSVSENGRTLVAFDVARAQALPFFRQYVNYLANVPVETLNRDEQLAYWLNTRNILLIQALAEERRITGFKRKRGTPDNPGSYWTEKRITVSGVPLSLQDIEQDILFAGWDNDNIIFGLYQANEGGPALPRSPFIGNQVAAQLAEAGRRFVTSPRNLRVRGDAVRISTYFDWYASLAYKGDEAAMREHLSSLVQPDLKDVVLTEGDLSRRNLSTSFEQFRTRQAGIGSGAGGSRPYGGTGS